jgi:hypothetical protein
VHVNAPGGGVTPEHFERSNFIYSEADWRVE